MTDNLTTLRALRDSVANATGPDRDIDADIAEIFGYVSPEYEDGPELCGVPATWAGGGKIWAAPKFTSSIDDAAAWVVRVLPGKCLTVQTGPSYQWAVVHEDDEEIPVLAFFAPTPSLALILAGLDALIEKERENPDGTS